MLHSLTITIRTVPTRARTIEASKYFVMGNIAKVSQYPASRCFSIKRSISIMFCVLLPLLVLFLFVASHFRIVIFSNNIRLQPSGLVEDSRAVLCTSGIMDRKTFLYDEGIGPFALNSKLQCPLHVYSKAEVTRCLDEVTQEKGRKHGRNLSHFVFIGDSRIRQQFYLFSELIPFYEYEQQQNTERHSHISIYSPVVNVNCSYYWSPRLNETILSLLRTWRASDELDNPDFIVIGFSSHYMMSMNGNDNQQFRNDIAHLWPALKGVHRRGSRIIWWNQDPPVEPFSNTDFSSQKMSHYNEIAQQIFRDNAVPVETWDSTNGLSNEYVRSCSLLPVRKGIFLKAWVFCSDFLHPGNAVILQSVQLLYNEICNPYVNRAES